MAEPDIITAQELRFERILDAPVDTVWEYLIDPEKRARWFMGGRTDARVGGKLGMTFHHEKLSEDDAPTPERYAKHVGQSWSETITRYEPPHVLAFTWSGGDAGEVTITLAPDGERTRLTLLHTGLRGADDASSFGAGWQAHLAVLEGRLNGSPVRDFWAYHEQFERETAARLAAAG